MTDLDKLIEAVKAGGILPRSDHVANTLDQFAPHAYSILAPNVFAAFNGSLDAALALHKAVLPKWFWCLKASEAVVGQDNDQHNITATADTPARAWLLAILRAMKERGDG